MAKNRGKSPTKTEYEGVLGTYLSKLTFKNTFLINFGRELDNLTEIFSRLHPSFLSKEDARNLIFDATFSLSDRFAGRTGDLSNPSNADVLNALQSAILGSLESLPRRYILKIELPGFFHWGTCSFQISDQLQLILKEKITESVFVNSILKSGVPLFPDRFNAFFEISISGYSTFQTNSHAVSTGLETAKVALFLFMLHGLIEVDQFERRRASSSLTCLHDKKNVEILLPDAASRRFGAARPILKNLTLFVPGSSLLGGKRHEASTNQEYIQAFQEKITLISSFFSQNNRPEYKKILAAIQWYEDSESSDNQTFSYIAACIGLEALLGDEGYMDGMSKRLSDRYAFLMGRNHQERQEMASIYTKILELRGKLVHGKEARLVGHDLQLLLHARTMLRDVIRREIFNMQRPNLEVNY